MGYNGARNGVSRMMGVGGGNQIAATFLSGHPSK
jgi:hypothetical protein